VACREGNAKRALVRLVRQADGSVVVDPTGKLAGRGAYLCSKPSCWTAGLRKGVLVRALKLERIRDEDIQALTAFAGQLPDETTEAADTAAAGAPSGPVKE
jgi:predicted RNA-binding protein YlxR (DUF448 family)